MKRTGIIVFLITLFIHLTGIILKNPVIEQLTKPLLLVILTGYFSYRTKGISTSLKKWILAALFFSWLGDVLLMFQGKDSLFFLLGLSAFLIAHIFYIFFFHSVRIQENSRGKILLLIPVLTYYAVLMTILSPGLGAMKLPVRIYGIVICLMLVLALHALFIKNRKTGLLLVVGAILFVVSDSVLAINKFHKPFEAAAVIVMSTYGLAQLFLTQGAIQYLRRQ